MELNSLCELIVDCEHKTAPTQDSGYPSIRTPNIGRGYFILEGVNRVSEETYQLWTRRAIPQAGDLIMAREAPVGNVALVPPGLKPCLGQRTLLIRPDRSKVVPSFLNYLLNGPEVQSIIHAKTNGATVPHLNMKDVRGLVLPSLPPLPTQQCIAGILSAYDELIENSQRRIKILESMARALYREWFIHFRFPGHESVPRVPSSLGEIPQGWEVGTVEQIVKRIPVGKKYDQKTVSPTGEVPVLDQGKTGIIGYHDDQPGVEATENAPVIVFANHTCYQRLVHFPFSAIQNVLPFVPHPSVARNIYWLHWATNGLVVFNDYKGHWPEFAAKQLVVPSESICQQFGDFVAPISRQILRLERVIQNLRRTRDLLLPRLLSGQFALAHKESVNGSLG